MDKSIDILKAIEFATFAHRNQVRKYNGRPYIEHPLAVARLVSRFNHTQSMLIAAILHDTVEDTPVTIEDVIANFGSKIGLLVSDLTDVSKFSDGNRSVRKNIDLQHTAKANPMAKTVKLMDLVHNSVSIVHQDKTFAKIYLKEKGLLLEVLGDASDMNELDFAKKIHARALNRIYLSAFKY